MPSLGVPEEPDRLNGHGPLDAAGVDAVAATEAVRLFVDRAAAILPGFQLDPTTVGPVAEICRRLDGIPLASSSRRPGSMSCRSPRSPLASVTGSGS